MDDRRFDGLVRSFGAGCSRKTLLKGLLGVGFTVSAASLLSPGDTEAARRGFSGPRFPTPPPCVPVCIEGSCGGSDGCGGTRACADGTYCSNGGCCEDFHLDEPGCFFMETTSGHYCWVPRADLGYDECEMNDFCSIGAGACFKWALSSNTQIAPPWN